MAYVKPQATHVISSKLFVGALTSHITSRLSVAIQTIEDDGEEWGRCRRVNGRNGLGGSHQHQ
jgi:hypothetical protein